MQNGNLKNKIDDLKLDIKTLKAKNKNKLREQSTQTVEIEPMNTKSVEAQTSTIEVTDKATETLLRNLDLDSEIEQLFSGFCKQALMQLGLSNVPKSHLRIFVYTGDEDDVVATSDYYSDYAKALEIMIEDGVENDEYAENDGMESEC